MSKKHDVAIEVHRDGMTGGLQLSIGIPDSVGYRIAGPKFSGTSESLLKRVLTQRDVDEIRHYLDMAFPSKESSAND